MALILESKEIAYNQHLTLPALEKHANGFLRYQNFSDLVTQGPAAVQAFIDRANLLFERNLERSFPQEAALVGPLELSYLSVFFREESEPAEEALPMTDFLKFRFQDHGLEKSGFGVFFSFFGRELDRVKLESGRDAIKVGASVAVYNFMFKAAFPDTGVLEAYPIMTMRQVKNGNANDLLHQYYKQLGTKLRTVQPHNCPGTLRCYHHGRWEAIDAKVRIAAVSLGQAMQECVRIEEYRRPGDPETENLPVLDWGHQRKVKEGQAQLAREWFARHHMGIQELIVKYEKRQKQLRALKLVGI
jgi:hypothetical protein